jgi:caffeoyl-CoA O-methyltransferase
MNFPSPEISEYAEQFSKAESQLLHELNRETHLKTEQPQMLSGHLQGRIQSAISHMIKPHRILEIGTFTGYSALCFAEGLSDDGLLITLDINEEFKAIAEKYFKRSEYVTKIRSITGNALELIPTLDETFDLVFIDADKENYSAYYDLVINKVSKGGYILADNVLWSGKVIDGSKDAETIAIKAFNNKVQKDERVENVLLPVRDGVMVCRKK